MDREKLDEIDSTLGLMKTLTEHLTEEITVSYQFLILSQ